ncbi:glycosyltransferase [Sphingomonas rhizophila]|uniref:Glycosyltransferase n=1 Tax=Sphingomonas rhizophila TaxID=2071607 RepID=A0A7G9S8T1_9SPHN|nr:glycosyltransferase [Sphingomonas rhizophila]QNN64256.1 glycosyltransferase [Sphingomonas rhizophila]
MARQDPPSRKPALYCDLTQSWSAVGGGVGTYLRHKRQHILQSTNASHLLIIPGDRDSVTAEEGGRATTVTIASPRVPGSPNYRLLLRNRAVRDALHRFQPNLIECQDAYNLPWAALAHARRNPGTATVAGYFTDFPTVYADRPAGRFLGPAAGRWAAGVCYRYCGRLYRRFDAVFALSEHGGAKKLRAAGVERVGIVPLGVELGQFGPDRRDDALRTSLGVAAGEPLLIYAGRLDVEKRPETVVDAFCQLPEAMRATLVLLGDGPLREPLMERARGRRIHLPGYVGDRGELARWLASADLYVSGMADETFGVSIIEAQASGLPVIGIGEGAMLDRVPPGLGRTGPIEDAAAMAANIQAVWAMDRSTIAAQARDHAETFSWDRSMTLLFGEIYVRALAAAARRGSSPVDALPPLVEAAHRT